MLPPELRVHHNNLPDEVFQLLLKIFSLPPEHQELIVQEILSVGMDEVRDVIVNIIKLKHQNEGKPGRKANRYLKILRVTMKNENSWIPLDEFFIEFEDTGNAAKNAANAIQALNNDLKFFQAGFALVGRSHNEIRYYRFQRVLNFDFDI